MNPFLARSIPYLALFACMLFFEARHPFVRSNQKKTHRVAFHFGVGVLNSLILVLVIYTPLYAAVRFTQSHAFGLTYVLGLGGWPEIIITLVVFDCWDYWMHRANHRLRFLWRFHKAHHSDMEIDVTTASRFHIGELLITNGVKGVMILLWGPSLMGIVVFEISLTAASQFHHGNLNIPLMPQNRLENGVVTPRMHRCHHVYEGRCRVGNYSTIFSIWDRLFRTYYRPDKPAELEPIGVSNPRGPETMRLVPMLLTPFREL